MVCGSRRVSTSRADAGAEPMREQSPCGSRAELAPSGTRPRLRSGRESRTLGMLQIHVRPLPVPVTRLLMGSQESLLQKRWRCSSVLSPLTAHRLPEDPQLPRPSLAAGSRATPGEAPRLRFSSRLHSQNGDAARPPWLTHLARAAD